MSKLKGWKMVTGIALIFFGGGLTAIGQPELGANVSEIGQWVGTIGALHKVAKAA